MLAAKQSISGNNERHSITLEGPQTIYFIQLDRYYQNFLDSIVLRLCAIILVSCLSSWNTLEGQDSLTVRVLDNQNPRIVQIYSPLSNLIIVNPANGEREALISKNQIVSLMGNGNETEVSWSERQFSTSKLRFKTRDGSPVHLRYGKSANELRDRPYRGIIEVGPDYESNSRHLLITNRIHLEDYVSGVIAREYPFREMEGIKAQAVIARTYALAAKRSFGSRYELTDTEYSQVYGGALAENYATRKATFETRGEVVMYKGRMIEAVYSSTCGGHSANNEDVWGTAPMPYLRGKADPFDAHSPFYNWSLDLNKKEAFQILSKLSGIDIKKVELGEIAKGGYVQTVVLRGNNRSKNISASRMRRSMNQLIEGRGFRSNVFEIEESGDILHVRGKGFGHGVGVCQYGVSGMAARGFSYRDILDFYYTDISIDKLSSADSWPEFSLDPAFPEKAIEPSFVAEVEQATPRTETRKPRQQARSSRRTSWNPWGSKIPESLRQEKRRKAW